MKKTKFKKEDFLKSKDFIDFKDALNVILEDEEMLTKEEVNDRLKDFYNKEVK